MSWLFPSITFTERRKSVVFKNNYTIYTKVKYYFYITQVKVWKRVTLLGESWKFSPYARTHIFDLPKAQVYILCRIVENYLKIRNSSLRKSGMTIYYIYQHVLSTAVKTSEKDDGAALEITYTKPALNLVYDYVKELSKRKFLRAFASKRGKDCYVPTQKGISTYLALQRQIEQEKEKQRDRFPTKNVKWNVRLTNCTNSSLPKKEREMFFDIDAGYSYETYLKYSKFIFKCVRDEAKFSEYLNCPEIEFTWKVAQIKGLRTSDKIFNIRNFWVDIKREHNRREKAIPEKIGSTIKDETLTLVYADSSLEVDLHSPVVISYEFYSILPKAKYFFVKLPWPARGFEIEIDYSKTNIKDVVVINDYWGIGVVSKVEQKIKEKLIRVTVNNKFHLNEGVGVAFVWS